MIPFPDPKLCPRTPGHKLYYKARRCFCKMENPKSRGEIFTRRPMIFQKDAPDAENGPTRAKISICNFCPAVLYYLILNPFRRCAIVAQLDRAFGSDPEGQRFESSRSHQERPIHNVYGPFFIADAISSLSERLPGELIFRSQESYCKKVKLLYNRACAPVCAGTVSG